MSPSRPEPFATVVPLYAGEIVVQLGELPLRIRVPPFLDAPVGTPAPPVMPDPREKPILDPGRQPPSPTVPGEPRRRKPWEMLPPVEPAALMLPLRRSSASQQFVGYVKVFPEPGRIGALGEYLLRPRRVRSFELSEHAQGAVSMQRLGALVASEMFDPTGEADVLLHARGPHVDLSQYTDALSLALHQGAEVVVFVHPPSATSIAAWPPPS